MLSRQSGHWTSPLDTVLPHRGATRAGPLEADAEFAKRKLVQHFAEGHDMKCAESSGLRNAAAAVSDAVAAAPAEVEGRSAKRGQRVPRRIEGFRHDYGTIIGIITATVPYEVSFADNQNEAIPPYIAAHCQCPRHN